MKLHNPLLWHLHILKDYKQLYNLSQGIDSSKTNRSPRKSKLKKKFFAHIILLKVGRLTTHHTLLL